MTFPPPTTFAGAFDALETLELAVQAACEAAGKGKPEVYKTRPRGQINLPAIYNVLEPSQKTVLDTVKDRDTLIIGVRIAVRHTDTGPEFDELLAIADIARDIFDRGLKDNDGPFGGLPAQRLGVRPQADEFGQTPVFAFEFPIEVKLEYMNAPSYP